MSKLNVGWVELRETHRLFSSFQRSSVGMQKLNVGWVELRETHRLFSSFQRSSVGMQKLNCRSRRRRFVAGKTRARKYQSPDYHIFF